jgi:hypothetical protein
VYGFSTWRVWQFVVPSGGSCGAINGCIDGGVIGQMVGAQIGGKSIELVHNGRFWPPMHRHSHSACAATLNAPSIVHTINCFFMLPPNILFIALEAMLFAGARNPRIPKIDRR